MVKSKMSTGATVQELQVKESELCKGFCAVHKVKCNLRTVI